MKSLSEIYVIHETIENVSNDRKFFWADRNDDLNRPMLQPGTEIRKFKGYPGTLDTEKFLEGIREDHYPDRPRRIGCVFVTPSIHLAMQWTSNEKLYQVEVTGKIFYTDPDIWTEISEMMWTTKSGHREINNEKLNSFAHDYWKGVNIPKRNNPYALPTEVLVDGTVKIVRSIDHEKIRNFKTRRQVGW